MGCSSAPTPPLPGSDKLRLAAAAANVGVKSDRETVMKITSYEATTLRVPEDDPLANMPEEAGRTRPVIILRLRTDNGIEGIGITFYGG